MAVRTEMGDLIVLTQRLVDDAGASTWSTTEAIQDSLDAHATQFDYMPLWHDSDYHVYKAQQRAATARQLDDERTRLMSEASYDVPDFGSFYRVGYLATNWAIRGSPDETTAAHSPNLVDTIGATFVFSTAPDQELYLRATGYNVWKAAVDLLLETPDTGRMYDTSRTRGAVTRVMSEKWTPYSQRGFLLNRRRRQLALV